MAVEGEPTILTISRTGAWLFLSCGLTAALLMLAALGLSIDWWASRSGVLLVAAGGGLALFRGRVQNPLVGKLIDALEGLSFFFGVAVFGILLTYAAAKVSVGYYDAWLAAADVRLGFDWTAMYDFMDRHRWLMVPSKQMYFSIFASPIIVVCAHALTGRTERLRAFLICFAIALAITAAVFLYVPAQSALPYWIGRHPSYPAAVTDQHVIVIDALRAGTLTIIDLSRPVGLVSFPSFHAAAALLFVWAAWPFPRLRLPLALLNLAMLITTPVEGSHYLVEIIAGLVVACVSIGCIHVPALRAAAGWNAGADLKTA